MKDPRLQPTPRCVCRHRELAHAGDRGRCLGEDCRCVGYWPTDRVEGTTRPVAR